jgi:hypothetical protein
MKKRGLTDTASRRTHFLGNRISWREEAMVKLADRSCNLADWGEKSKVKSWPQRSKKMY